MGNHYQIGNRYQCLGGTSRIKTVQYEIVTTRKRFLFVIYRKSHWICGKIDGNSMKRMTIIIFVLTVAIITVVTAVLLFYRSGGRSEHYLFSEYLNENRRFLVHLPKDYETAGKKYPVLFLLDGGDRKIHSNDKTTYSKAVTTLNRLDRNVVPELIMVGIANKNRYRDMLPVKGNDYVKGGGAARFLEFITKELVPYIDKHYRTTGTRILYGESDAGLFTVFAMLKKPGAFYGYIASSPTLGWCPEVLDGEMEKFFDKIDKIDKINKIDSKTYLYIIYGEKDPLLVTRYVKTFSGKFLSMQRTKERKTPVWDVREVKNSVHIPPSSLFDGLNFIFR